MIMEGLINSSHIVEECFNWIVQPEYEEASDDRKTALYCHVKQRKQYHSSSLSSIQNSYTLGDKNESS
jgi:hypothetical protein